MIVKSDIFACLKIKTLSGERIKDGCRKKVCTRSSLTPDWLNSDWPGYEPGSVDNDNGFNKESNYKRKQKRSTSVSTYGRIISWGFAFFLKIIEYFDGMFLG